MEGDAAQYGPWGNDPRVQEVGTEEDSDSDDVGRPPRRTGSAELTSRTGGLVRQRSSFQVVEDGDGDLVSTEDDDEDDDDDDIDYGNDKLLNEMSPAMEEVLVQNALMRISKAQAKGKRDVRLDKAELAALERRRRRMEEEEERRQRRKRKENRVAVPLAQLESFTRLASQASSEESLDMPANQAVPPMGYFPPLAGSRSRSQGDGWPVAPSHDPFQYQTEGPRVPSSSGGTASSGPRRHASSASGGSGTGSSEISSKPSRRQSLDAEVDEATDKVRQRVQTRASTKSHDGESAARHRTVSTSSRGGSSVRGTAARGRGGSVRGTKK